MIIHLIHCSHTETHKSRGVVVPDGLGITKGLQSWVSLDDLILQGTLNLFNKGKT